MNIDDAGGGVTGGLVASALEKPTGRAGEAHGTCTDCGAAVSRRFCAECGQPTRVHRKLSHLGEELLHGVMHFDGRLWKTLPLLFFKPGVLTRDWVSGKRTRYVSPLAAFLFVVFLMVFLVNVAPPSREVLRVGEDVSTATGEVATIAARAKASTPAAAGQDTATARAVFHSGSSRTEAAAAPSETADDGDQWEMIKEKARSGAYDHEIDTGNAALDKKLRAKLRNPDLTIYKIEQALYKLAFLLVPLSIPAVALLFFWKRETTLYDHGVFVLYSLTFMVTLLLFATYAEDTFLSWPAGIAFVFAPPVHIFFQLKDAYGLSVFSALWRTVALLLLSWTVLLVWFVIILLLGVLG